MNSETYDQLIASFPEIERKGKTMPYTSLNGHMFTFLAKDGNMGLRLSESDREVFLKEFKSSLMEQHGKVMKEFVVVTENLLSEKETIVSWIEKSVAYTASLKPK